MMKPATTTQFIEGGHHDEACNNNTVHLNGHHDEACNNNTVHLRGHHDEACNNNTVHLRGHHDEACNNNSSSKGVIMMKPATTTQFI